MVCKVLLAALTSFTAMLPQVAAAQDEADGLVPVAAAETAAPSREVTATFAPRPDGRDHRLDYGVWTEALQAYVVSMGPPLRKMPATVAGPPGSRIRHGPGSMYRTDGAMVGFSIIHRDVIANIGRYRRELQAVGDSLDIASLPRNEQLAFWLNLHNVAMMEKIGEAWPIRQPRDIEVDGVPLEDARFITVRGVAMSPRDIREGIVYAHWRNPVVIYGFWRGEIGGPAIQRQAFTGEGLADQLDRAAREFINSRRGTEKRGDTLHISRFYNEAAPFYFPDFEPDMRGHMARYVEGPVTEMLAKSTFIRPTIYEYDIADLSGGRRSNLFFSTGRLDVGASIMLAERQRKLDYIRRTQPRAGIVTFSNIDLPGDPPDKGEVE